MKNESVATCPLPVGREFTFIVIGGRLLTPQDAANALGAEIVIDGKTFRPNKQSSAAP